MSVDLIIEGPVAKIVLNRPEKLNALTYEMRAQLRDYTQQLRFDENVRAIIVTGEGRAFCTGADVGRMQRGGLRAEREKMQGGSHQFLRTLHATEKPVIAAVRGPTVGVRLAIGALEREVLLQFLIEAVVLASIGGLIGVALATAASAVLARVMEVPWLFDPSINLLSFGFSAAIGVVFGYFPARRAARLDPIDALRHE